MMYSIYAIGSFIQSRQLFFCCPCGSSRLQMHKSWHVKEYKLALNGCRLSNRIPPIVLTLEMVLLEVSMFTWKLRGPLAALDYLCFLQLLAKTDQHLFVLNFLPTKTLPPQREFSTPRWTAFFYKSMIEIVCDNRHSNWAAHNDKRAKNRLNTIYKSLKWQGLQ